MPRRFSRRAFVGVSTLVTLLSVGAFEFVVTSSSQVVRTVVEGYWGTLTCFAVGTAVLVADALA